MRTKHVDTVPPEPSARRSGTPWVFARGISARAALATTAGGWIAAAVVLAVLSASCASTPEVARRRQVAPLVEPVGFALESHWFEVPRARLGEFRVGTVLFPGTIAGRIDEDRAAERLRDASRVDREVVAGPSCRAEFVHEGRSARLAPTDPSARPHVDDRVRLEARATLGTHWQAYDLHFDLEVRFDASAPLRLVGSTEMPPDLWLQFVAVPADESGSAVVVFARAVRVWPPDGDA